MRQYIFFCELNRTPRGGRLLNGAEQQLLQWCSSCQTTYDAHASVSELEGVAYCICYQYGMSCMKSEFETMCGAARRGDEYRQALASSTQPRDFGALMIRP